MSAKHIHQKIRKTFMCCFERQKFTRHMLNTLPLLLNTLRQITVLKVGALNVTLMLNIALNIALQKLIMRRRSNTVYD